MPYEVPEHFASMFTTNVELLLQQKKAVMDRGIAHKSYMGESAQVVKQFGEVEFGEKEVRYGDTEFTDLIHKQRWLFPIDYDLALPVDSEDELRMLNSPTSSYVEAMRAGWNRKVNQVIIEGALGVNKTGKNGSVSTAFDTNQVVPHGGTGLTVDKLRKVKEMFFNNEVEEGTKLYWAHAGRQLTNLLETTEVTSSEYNAIKALVHGEVNTFMGFEFIPNSRLPMNEAGQRRNIAWAENGIALGTWRGLDTKISERPDKKYITQVFMRGTIAATRTQEEMVVEVECVEA